MNNELLSIVSYLERDRGVSREIIVQAIESAILQAAKRGVETSKSLRIEIDRRTLELRAFDTFTVSSTKTGPQFITPAVARRYRKPDEEGASFEMEINPTKLGRIAASSARQMILQKIREAERKNVYDEYKERIGDIVSGTVKQKEKRDIIVDLGKAEAILPAKERIPTEEFAIGDRIRAFIHRVGSESGTPAIVLSRACPEFLKTLFRLEVSEIADGIVEIMAVARDPGFRSKIAVKTLDEKVDPVGACVGLRGARVRNIVRELNGEKIDIVRWSDDIKTFVKEALNPAKLETIEIDKTTPRTIHVTVAPDQLSLAIGKRGQNVRLTSKLTGWRVSITKVTEQETFAEQRDVAVQSLAETLDVDASVAELLVSNGFLTPDGILASDVPYVCEITGMPEAMAQELFEKAKAAAGIVE